MQPSKAIKNYIKAREGVHYTPYIDVAGYATIGVGHKILGNHDMFLEEVLGGEFILADLELTPAQVDKLLDIRLSEFSLGVNNMVVSYNLNITQSMFDAIISFAYNLGTGALRRSTLLKLLRQGDIDGAAKEFLKWRYAGGKVVQGILNRRIEEMNIFLTKSIVDDIIIPGDLTRKKDREYMSQLIRDYRRDYYEH